MHQHVDSIALSSRQQAAALAKINTPVNSLDHTTQQNAAVVEKATAASASLANGKCHPS